MPRLLPKEIWNHIFIFCSITMSYQNIISHLKGFTKSCLTFCDPMGYSMPGFPVFQYLQEFAQIHVQWVSDVIYPSHPLLPPSLLALNLSQHQGLFQWVNFTSGGQSIEASASVLPMNIQVWFSLGLTSVISLLSKELLRVLQQHSLKASTLWHSAFFNCSTLTSVHDSWKNHSSD